MRYLVICDDITEKNHIVNMLRKENQGKEFVVITQTTSMTEIVVGEFDGEHANYAIRPWKYGVDIGKKIKSNGSSAPIVMITEQ